MLKEKLLALNFTANQADVYLALLELGQTKVGPLITKTGFHRNLVYRALDDLINLKLVNRISKRGIFYYQALDPAPLMQKAKQEVELTKETIKAIHSIKQKSTSEVMIFSGRQGLIDLYDIFVDQAQDVYLLGATFDFVKRFKTYIPKLKEKLDKKDIKHIVLAQSQAKEVPEIAMAHQVKYLPKYFPPTPHVIWISGKIVAHVIWEEPEAIFIIKNKKIADNYKSYFNLLWKKIK